MTDATTPYPLQWPTGRPRRPLAERKDGRFKQNGRALTTGGAIRRLQTELDRIGAKYAVINSNLETRLDGLPRSGQRTPDDPGVAVYFQLAGKPHCFPCDTYNSVADNIAAVAAHIAATRAIERYGVATVSEMFVGFLALPPPQSWRKILGFDEHEPVRPTEIEAAYRRLAAERHPDRGGSDAMMAELNFARDAARREA